MEVSPNFVERFSRDDHNQGNSSHSRRRGTTAGLPKPPPAAANEEPLKILLPLELDPLHSPSLFMAKTCWIKREKRRTALASKYADVRAKMKKEGDYVGLSLLPRDASPSRQSRRCQMTGRKRAFIGRFKLSRIAFRELASQGLIPGVTKSSW